MAAVVTNRRNLKPIIAIVNIVDIYSIRTETQTLYDLKRILTFSAFYVIILMVESKEI